MRKKRSQQGKIPSEKCAVQGQENELNAGGEGLASEDGIQDTGANSDADPATVKETEKLQAPLVTVPPGVVPTENSAEDDTQQEMTFTEHLNELRSRLLRCIIAVFIGLLACYAFAETLFRRLMEPLLLELQPLGGALIYTGLPEAFFTHLKVAAVAGLFLTSPYIFYQLWLFVAPGLYEGERKFLLPIAVCSAAFFVLGALFGYYVVFPFGFHFFLSYASDIIKPMPSVREYFSFATSMLFAFGVIFELPLVMFFLARLGLVTYKSLRKFQKYAVLGSFVVAAVLTPPDVVSQTLMAGPLCILYEVGVWVAYVCEKKPAAGTDDVAA